MFVLLALKLFLDLSSNSVLTFYLIHLSLGGRLFPLLTNHQFHLLRMRFLFGALLFDASLNGFFFQLGVVGCAARVIDCFKLFVLSSLILFTRSFVVSLSLRLLFSLLLLASNHLGLLRFIVALSLVRNLVSAFSSFLDFFNRLESVRFKRDLLFLLQT